MLLYKEIVYNRTYYIISLQKLISLSLLLLLLTGSSRDVLPHQTGINSRFFWQELRNKGEVPIKNKDSKNNNTNNNNNNNDNDIRQGKLA